MITNKDIRVENGNLVLNGNKYPLDGQSPEAIMQIVEDNSDTTPTADSANPVTSAGIKTYVDTKIGDVKSSILMGRGAFPPAEIGDQEVQVNFTAAFAHAPAVMVAWDDTSSLQSVFKYPLKITDITTTGFKVKAERLAATSTWYIRYIAIDIS